MGCKINTPQGIEVRASNGAPSLLYQKIKTLGKSENESLKIYGQLLNLSDYEKDANGEPNLTIGGTSKHFDNLLVALASQGVSIQSMEDYAREHLKRTGNALKDNVRGVTDTINNIIAYSKGNASLTEEAVHMATASGSILNSSPMQRAMSLVDITTDQAKRYMKIFKDEKLVRKELVDKQIVDHLITPATGRIKQTIKSILNRIKKLFGKPTLEMLVQDIATQITSPEFEVNDIQQDQLQFMLDETELVSTDLTKAKKVIEKFIDRLKQHVNEAGSFIDTKLLDTMLQNINKKQDDLAIINSVNHIQKRVRDGHARLIEISNQKDPKKNEVAQQLRNLQDVFDLYEPYIKELDGTKLGNAELTKELGTVILDLSRYKEDFLTVRRLTLGHILLPHFKVNPKYKTFEDIEPLMLQAEELVPWEAWMSAMADASDEMLKVLDQYTKETNIKVETKSKVEIKKLMTLFNKLKDKTFDRFYQKNNDNELGTHFLSQYDTEKHSDSLDKLLTSLRSTYLVSEDSWDRKKQFIPGTKQAVEYGNKLRDLLKKDKLPFTLYRKNGKKLVPITYDWISTNYRGDSMQEDLISRVHNVYKMEQAKWFSANNAPVDNVAAKVQESFDKTIDLYLIGDLTKYRAKVKSYFRTQKLVYAGGKIPNFISDIDKHLKDMDLDVIEDQRQDIYTTLYKIQSWQENSIGTDHTGETYFKFDLSRPSNAYFNPDYGKLSSEDRTFLNYLHELKKKNLDMKYTHDLDLAPQMHKSVQERIETGDVAGMYNSAKEMFVVSPDDTEFGGESKHIPIFFQSKLDPSDMSRDIVTTMAGYIAMANHHVEFNKIEGVLQMALDQLDSRTIVKQEEDRDGDTIFVETGQTGGSTAKRAKTYVDMIVYKKTKAKEAWLPQKWIKRIDKFMNWVSLNSLGGNMYSGVANVFTSAATRLQERAASKIVAGLSDASYKKAMRVYTKYGIKNLLDYGTANTDNPFTVMSQFMGIMEDFTQDLVMNDAGKSRALNILKQLPFAPNTIGEHAVAHNTALAMMEEVKLVKNGEPISLLDAMMVIKDGVPDLTGVETKDGHEFTLEMARKTGLAINRQNQVLFGIYNEIDKSAAQQFVIGRAISQFRKFFIPGLYRRYQKENFDYQLGVMREGMYRTSWEMLNRVRLQVMQDRNSLLSATQAEWDVLSVEKKKNIVRSIVELGSITAGLVFGALLTAAAEDDEDNAFLAFAAYQANRHFREMSTFALPTSFTEIMKSPAASVNQLERVLGIASSIDPIGALQGDPFFSQYKDGSEETKAWRNTKRLLPFYSTGERLLDAQGQFNMTK